MPKLRIFISHSAKDDFTAGVRDLLYHELAQRDFVPILDKEGLQPGDPWRRQLRTWLGLCHGAVVLFSKNVFASTPERPVGSAWVLNEAAILVWRRELNPDFLVVPVMLPGVEVTKLNQGPFEPLNLPEIQALTVPTAEGECAPDIVARIIAQLETLRARLGVDGPLERLKQSLAEDLNNLSDSALETIADQLGIDLTPWRVGEPLTAAFVCALFHQEINLVADAIEKLAGYTKVSKATLRKLRDILTAFWVEPAAVQPIPHVIKQPEKRRAVVLRATQPLIATMYLQRACCLYPSWPETELTDDAGPDEANRLTLAIVASLRDRLQLYDRGKPRPDQAVKQFVQKMYAKKPLFIIFPRFIDVEVLAQVREEFPTVTFFLLEQEPIDRALLKANAIELLEPDLTPAKEQDVVDIYDYTRQFVD